LSKLLITGGSGDLGRVLSKKAAAAGFDVTVTYFSRPERIIQGKPIRLDLGDHVATQALLDSLRPDAIIHTALTQGLPDPRKQIIEAARDLKAFADRHSSTRLIMLSSDMVFDGTKPPYPENDPASPLSSYGAGKAELEALGGCVVRTSLIYDFEPGNRQVDWLLDKIATGHKCPLFWDEYRSPIWAANLADALVELVHSNIDGILNVAGPSRMSRLELGQGLLRALGYNPEHHVESVSQEGTGRPRDLTLDVSKAQKLLRTPLLGFEEARTRWQAEREHPISS
jgi:dTDP-4-dehydrorhamnose reductase